jgi:multisubunit Na+/H+ antiporter MnhB subunit
MGNVNTSNIFLSISMTPFEELFNGISMAALLNADYHLYLCVGLVVLFIAVLYLFFYITLSAYLVKYKLNRLLSIVLNTPESKKIVPASVYITECSRSEEY